MSNNKLLSMKEIQRISLDILKFITKICDSEGIKYCLMYGTLIGAIRHHGFIPWDDDIDIMMPRSDYERFLDYASNHKFNFGYYEVYNRKNNKNYMYGITRVSDSRYIIEKNNEKNCGMGIFIDIYPYDGLGNDYELALRKLNCTRKYCDIIADTIKLKWSVPKQLNYKGKIVYVIYQIINRIFGINKYLNKIEKLKGNYTYENSIFVGPLMWFFTKPEKILFKRELFDVLIKVKFEDDEFYVPKEYDKILTQEYGDYMQLPPPEKRIYQHDYIAWKK